MSSVKRLFVLPYDALTKDEQVLRLALLGSFAAGWFLGYCIGRLHGAINNGVEA